MTIPFFPHATLRQRLNAIDALSGQHSVSILCRVQHLLQAPAASALPPAAGECGDSEADIGTLHPVRQTAGCEEDDPLSCAGALHYHQRRSGVPADETDEAAQNEHR